MKHNHTLPVFIQSYIKIRKLGQVCGIRVIGIDSVKAILIDKLILIVYGFNEIIQNMVTFYHVWKYLNLIHLIYKC